MAVTTPQFDAPFRLDTTGQPVTVQQGTIEEIEAAVYNIVICPQGGKLGDAKFGIPDLLFQNLPVDTSGVTAAIQQFEPRANTAITTTVLGSTGVVDMQVGVQQAS